MVKFQKRLLKILRKSILCSFQFTVDWYWDLLSTELKLTSACMTVGVAGELTYLMTNRPIKA